MDMDRMERRFVSDPRPERSGTLSLHHIDHISPRNPYPNRASSSCIPAGTRAGYAAESRVHLNVMTRVHLNVMLCSLTLCYVQVFSSNYGSKAVELSGCSPG